MRQKVHIIDPTDLDHALCGRDFRTVESSVHPELSPNTLQHLTSQGLVCASCLKEAARVNCKTTAGFRAFLQRRKAAADKRRRQKDAPRKSLR